jgi:hypothetical protein
MLVQQARYNFGPGGLKHHRLLLPTGKHAQHNLCNRGYPVPRVTTERERDGRDLRALLWVGHSQADGGGVHDRAGLRTADTQGDPHVLAP